MVVYVYTSVYVFAIMVRPIDPPYHLLIVYRQLLHEHYIVAVGIRD